METISHGEMRNRSGDVVRRVETGESVRLTNNGRVSALIVPATGATLEALVARGEARAPVSERSTLLELELSPR